MLKAKLTDRATQVRFLRFLAVGGSSAGVRIAVVALMARSLAPGFAFSIAFACSTTAHYLLNRFWALPSGRRDAGQQLGEYLVTVGISYLINLGAFKLCQDILGLSVIWAACWAIPPSTVVVFLLLNFRVFRA